MAVNKKCGGPINKNTADLIFELQNQGGGQQLYKHDFVCDAGFPYTYNVSVISSSGILFSTLADINGSLFHSGKIQDEDVGREYDLVGYLYISSEERALFSWYNGELAFGAFCLLSASVTDTVTPFQFS